MQNKSESGYPLTSEAVRNFAAGFFNENLETFQSPGAVLVVVQGQQVLHLQGYGYASLEASLPVDAVQTVFRVGSVSKLFTATAVMQLVERGQLDLEADINQYLTRFQVHSPDGAPVTAAQLLTHTAGFEENYLGMHVKTPEDLTPLDEFLAEHLPRFASPPGEVISYNDHGMSLAGYLVEAVTGLTFEQYVKENLLQPLGMESSTFSQPIPSALLDRLATGYRFDGKTFTPYEFDYVHVAPAAALVSSAENMSRFMVAQLNRGAYDGQSILSPETLAQMQSQQFSHHALLRGRAYGFSEWVENGQRGLFHDGGMPGFVSRLFLLPEHQVGFFISINGDQQSKASRLSREFTTRFLDAFYPETEIPIANPTPPADFASHAGRYTGYYREMAGYSSTTFTKLASLLEQVPVKRNADNTLSIGSGLAVEVEPDIFKWKDSQSYAVFQAGPDGEVDYLFYGTAALKKLPWFDAQPFQFGLVLLFVTGFIAMIATSLFARPLEPLVRLGLGAVGLLNLVFLVGIGLVLLNLDHWHIFYGLPFTIKLLLLLPLLAVLITFGLAVFIGLFGQVGDSLTLRTWLALLVTIAVGFIPYLHYWNLLGFRQ